MKRFEFSLDRLLRVKRQLERLAELEQQRARQAADDARDKLQSFHDQLARAADHLTAAVGRPLAAAQWAAASDFSERIGTCIRTSEQEVETAEQKYQAATQERAHLATEVEALDTLRRQQFDLWKQEAERANQGRLDEVVLQQWTAARESEQGPTP